LYANNVGHWRGIYLEFAGQLRVQPTKRIPVTINIAFVCSTIFTLRSLPLCFAGASDLGFMHFAFSMAVLYEHVNV